MSFRNCIFTFTRKKLVRIWINIHCWSRPGDQDSPEGPTLSPEGSLARYSLPAAPPTSYPPQWAPTPQPWIVGFRNESGLVLPPGAMSSTLYTHVAQQLVIFVTKRWKTPGSPATEEWHPHTREGYSSRRRDKALAPVTVWRNLEDMMLRDKLTSRDKHRMTPVT